jgi:hypothetical protein
MQDGKTNGIGGRCIGFGFPSLIALLPFFRNDIGLAVPTVRLWRLMCLAGVGSRFVARVELRFGFPVTFEQFAGLKNLAWRNRNR